MHLGLRDPERTGDPAVASRCQVVEVLAHDRPDVRERRRRCLRSLQAVELQQQALPDAGGRDAGGPHRADGMEDLHDLGDVHLERAGCIGRGRVEHAVVVQAADEVGGDRAVGLGDHRGNVAQQLLGRAHLLAGERQRIGSRCGERGDGRPGLAGPVGPRGHGSGKFGASWLSGGMGVLLVELEGGVLGQLLGNCLLELRAGHRQHVHARDQLRRCPHLEAGGHLEAEAQLQTDHPRRRRTISAGPLLCAGPGDRRGLQGSCQGRGQVADGELRQRDPAERRMLPRRGALRGGHHSGSRPGPGSWLTTSLARVARFPPRASKGSSGTEDPPHIREHTETRY